MASEVTGAAAAALLEDVQADAAEAVEETPVAEEPAAEEVPALDPEIPGDIQALLDPDPEEDEPEFTDEPDEPETVAEVEEWEDPGKLRRQLNKLTKKNEYLEKQNLKVQRVKWQEEIGQYFPLADAAAIAAQSTSRRDALRVANEQHSTAKKGAESIAQHYEQNIEKIVEQRIAQERERLYAQWGRPIGGPGEAPVNAAERAARDEDVQNARTLHERTLMKIQRGTLGPELQISESEA